LNNLISNQIVQMNLNTCFNITISTWKFRNIATIIDNFKKWLINLVFTAFYKSKLFSHQTGNILIWNIFHVHLFLIIFFESDLPPSFLILTCFFKKNFMKIRKATTEQVVGWNKSNREQRKSISMISKICGILDIDCVFNKKIFDAFIYFVSKLEGELMKNKTCIFTTNKFSGITTLYKIHLWIICIVIMLAISWCTDT